MKTSHSKHIAAAAAVLLGSLAAAQAGSDKRHEFDPEEFAEHMVDRIGDRLDLSDAQEDELEGLIKTAAAEMQQQRQQIAEQAAAAFAGDSFSEQDAQRMFDSLEGMKDTRHRIMTRTMAELHGVLTPEQRAEAGELLAEHGNWFAGHGFSGGHSRRGHHDYDGDHKKRRRGDHDDD